jgi:RHS repeat-associated protein
VLAIRLMIFRVTSRQRCRSFAGVRWLAGERFVDDVGDTDITLYGYDQRNRLVLVSHVSAWASRQATGLANFTAKGTALPGSDLELRYTYDYADRRIRRSLDGDGAAGIGQESVSFAAYAGDVRTLEIAQTATVSAGGRVIGFLSQVGQRNFYGNGEDEILAVDKLTWTGAMAAPTSTTSTFWTFTDHQNSVRDIVSGTLPTLGQIVEHRQYDSFGRMLRQTTGPQAGAATTPGVGIDFGYAGRPLEARTGLSDNRARWYEPGTGKFINEDPSGFKGGDANLFRYVGNDPLNQVDPSGLTGKYAQSAGRSGVSAAGFGAYGAGGAGIATMSLAAPNGMTRNMGFATVTTGTNSIVMGPGGTTSVGVVSAQQSSSSFGIRDAASLGVDFAPVPLVGSAKSMVEFATGYDYIADRDTSRVLAAFGIVAGVAPYGKGLLKGGSKIINAAARTADVVGDAARAVGSMDGAVSGLNGAAKEIVRVTQFYNLERGSFGPGASNALATPPNQGVVRLFEGPLVGAATSRTYVSPYAATDQSWVTRMMTGRGTYRNYVEFDVPADRLQPIGGLKGATGLGYFQQYIPGDVSLSEANAKFGQLPVNYGQYIFCTGAGIHGGSSVYEASQRK